MDRAAFVAEQQRLLQLERQAELAEAERLLRTRSDAELAARGTTLLRLAVADLEPGFGGRLCAVLQPSRPGPLPAHRFAPGDVVALREAREGTPVATAVVLRTRAESLTLALDDEEVDLPPLLRLDRLATDVTYRRLADALRALLRDRTGEEGRYLDTMFGAREPRFADRPSDAEIRFCDPNLDPAQRAAVAHALRAEPVALIHGPPGTGKTTAVVELIRQAVLRGERVLATAPSNVAVDNLAERLAAAGLSVVRLGHPARVAAAVRDVSLAALVDNAPEQKLLRTVRREVEQGLRAVHKARSRAERATARAEVRQLRSELRQLEGALTRGFVDAADVVLATLVGAADPLLDALTFDRVVVDEAAQALEAACWIPLQRARRITLAGDHCQLPPTLHSEAAARGGLATTLFERLAAGQQGPLVTRMLTRQYRMHTAIMGWSAQRFYAGRLEAAPQVAGHRLCDLPGVSTTEWTEAPLCFVDTAGTGFEESVGEDDGSKHNQGEAELVAKLVAALRSAGVAATDIAVVTPYNAQVQALRLLLAHETGLEIGTIDGLQGREKEAVVLSLVRSNERGEVGFLAELRRLNVALTRARRHLCVVGDSATLAHHPELLGLCEHLMAHGWHRSAFELG